MKFKGSDFIGLIEGVLNERIMEENKKLHLYKGNCFVSAESSRCLIKDFYSESFEGTINAYPFLYLFNSMSDIEGKVEKNKILLKSQNAFTTELAIPFLPLELTFKDLEIGYNKEKAILPQGFSKKATTLFANYRAQGGIFVPFVLSYSGLGVFDPTRVYIHGKSLLNRPVFLPFRVLDILALTEFEEVFWRDAKNSCLFEIDNKAVLEVAKGFDVKEQEKFLNIFIKSMGFLKFYADVDGKTLRDALKLINVIESEPFCEIFFLGNKIQITGVNTKITIDAKAIKIKEKFKVNPRDIISFLSDGPVEIRGYDGKIIGFLQGEEQLILMAQA